MSSAAEPGGELCRPAYDLEKPSTLLVSWRPPQTRGGGCARPACRYAGDLKQSWHWGATRSKSNPPIKNSTAYSIGVSHTS